MYPVHDNNADALPCGSEALCTRKHRYRIERVLGRGGFGITYLATCLQDFSPSWGRGEVIPAGSKLAIKECFPRDYAYRSGDSVVRPRENVPGSDWHLEDKSRMFLREAETLSIISAQHRCENLVPIYHCGRLERANITFFVMPYVQGGALTNYAGTLDPHQAADILFQLLQALEQCHGRSKPMLHLDIKPDNVMMKDGGLLRRKRFFFTTGIWQRWVPVLIDFGLARQSADGHFDIKGLTRGFAPWEQAHPKNAIYVGPWTDLYALGATMYAAITGQKPPAHDERPPHTEADPYRPLMQMPWVVERFREANPVEGERLLRSIDAALTLRFYDNGQNRPVRWQSAKAWREAAFPYGPWGPPLGFGLRFR